MVTDNEVKNQIAIAKSMARQKEYWEDRPKRLAFYRGYKRALKWVVGQSKELYNKEDI